jgi:soluble lytic murein transglycosylase-like protein
VLKRLAAGLAAATPLLFAASVPASAAPSARASQYFTLREKSQLVPGLLPQTLQLRGKQYAGKVVEVKGAITGSARRDQGGTIVVHSGVTDAEYVIEVGAEIPESQLEIGQNVRLLAKVVPVAGSEQAELQLTALVNESEALQAEAGLARIAAEKRDAEQRAAQRREAARQAQAARSRGRQQFASRGMPPSSRRQAAAGSPQQVFEAYRSAVMCFNHRISPQEAGRIAGNIITYSTRYGLDARLVMAVVAVESNFNSNAVSRAGAMGLGQLMPGTASGLGVNDPFSPEENIDGATYLLRNHIASMARHNGKLTMHEIQLALACYNAGAGAVKKYKGIPPYRETQNYVDKVTRLYYQFCGVNP